MSELKMLVIVLNRSGLRVRVYLFIIMLLRLYLCMFVYKIKKIVFVFWC